MLYSVEVRTNNQRKWCKLSVKMRSIESLKRDLDSYIVMYAQDKQLNHHSIMARIIDNDGNIVHFHDSNANVNKR